MEVLFPFPHLNSFQWYFPLWIIKLFLLLSSSSSSLAFLSTGRSCGPSSEASSIMRTQVCKVQGWAWHMQCPRAWKEQDHWDLCAGACGFPPLRGPLCKSFFLKNVIFPFSFFLLRDVLDDDFLNESSFSFSDLQVAHSLFNHLK